MFVSLLLPFVLFSVVVMIGRDIERTAVMLLFLLVVRKYNDRVRIKHNPTNVTTNIDLFTIIVVSNELKMRLYTKAVIDKLTREMKNMQCQFTTKCD